jgi:hypothetical protein
MLGTPRSALAASRSGCVRVGCVRVGCVRVGCVRAGCVRTSIVILGAAALAACAHTKTPAPASRSPDAAVTPGIIAAVRVAAAMPLGKQDARSRILLALGGRTGGAATQAENDVACEFIVRAADGHTVSIVQPNPENLRPGERVLVIHGVRTRIVRGGAVAAE